MKITDVKTWVVGNPPPGIGGKYFIFVRLTTDGGVVGYGEAYNATFSAHITAKLIEDMAERYLVGDDPHDIATFLHDQQIPAESRMRRFRLDRDRHLDVDVWLFAADAHSFDIAVLPMTALRQAPLSPINEKPMPRASVSQLRMLLAENEMREHDGG